MSDNSLHATARAFAANRFPVFPVHGVRIIDGRRSCSCSDGDKCKSPAKHPLWFNWPGTSTTDPATIDRLWQGAAWNIGLITGAASRLVVIDIDPGHGGDETLARLEREHGQLPPTPRFLTGGGGEHILFAHPGHPIANSVGRLGPGIDTRGDGGYIVAPPSEHISGRRYAISVDHHPEDVPFAPLPEWIIAALGRQSAIVARNWSEFAGAKIGEGRRNSELASLAGLLLRQTAIDPELAATLVLSWNLTHCSPPLDNAEVAAIINSIARREAARLRAQYHA